MQSRRRSAFGTLEMVIATLVLGTVFVAVLSQHEDQAIDQPVALLADRS